MQIKVTDLEVYGFLRFEENSNTITLVPPGSLSNTYTFTLPTGLPGGTSLLQVDNTGQLSYATPGGTGTVTSVDLSLPLYNISGNPITTSGTLTGSLASQTANRFFMSPDGSPGAPSFRQPVYSDISNLVGTGVNTLAAGNDTRFHTQNTDTGTTSLTFAVASGNANELRLTPTTGNYLEIRDEASALANIRVNDIDIQGVVTGTIFQVNVEEITLDDNLIILNSNYTGSSPSENGGFQVERGTVTNAELIWNETTDSWEAGINGATFPIVRKREVTFTSANVTAGAVDITHNLGTSYPASVLIYDNTDAPVFTGWSPQSTNVTRIDVSSLTITGTWRAVITG
jgi:hypothetical protein